MRIMIMHANDSGVKQKGIEQQITPVDKCFAGGTARFIPTCNFETNIPSQKIGFEK